MHICHGDVAMKPLTDGAWNGRKQRKNNKKSAKFFQTPPGHVPNMSHHVGLELGVRIDYSSLFLSFSPSLLLNCDLILTMGPLGMCCWYEGKRMDVSH